MGEKTKMLPAQQKTDDRKRKRKQILHRIRMDKWLYILMIPGLLHILIFRYVPMYGVLLHLKTITLYRFF